VRDLHRMNYETIDWPRLDRLRALFLGEQFGGGAYWREEADLAAYDATLGERIGWKWDAVLRELKLRRWEPPAGCELWDWGCGSGVAGRRVLEAWPGSFTGVRLTDHSPVAVEFARARLAAGDPPPVVTVAPRSETDGGPYVLCLSHVWNELPVTEQAAVRRRAAGAEAVIWVEPGTHSAARALQEIRKELGACTGHRVVAPCTHQDACGLLAAGNERHWCHHFADPPPQIFADSDWVRFGQRAGVDLRSIPYSFLVTERTPRTGRPSEPDDLQRVLGSPRIYKGFARVLFCSSAAVSEMEVPQRVAPSVYKAWSKGRGGVLYKVTPDLHKAGRTKTISPWEPT